MTTNNTALFEGQYKLEKSEHFDEFLRELGLNFVTRNLAKSTSPVVSISVELGLYTLRTTSAVKSSQIQFRLGQEFDEVQGRGGKTIRSVVHQEAENKLVQIQFGPKEVVIEREFSPQGLTVTATVNNVTSVRFYRRLTSLAT